MKKKIVLTILVILVLSVISAVICLNENYESSEKGITKKYYKEVEEILNLEEKRKLIVMKKFDLNVDGTEDYIGLTGIEKYHEDVKAPLKELNSSIELYQDTELIYIDGVSKEVKKYVSEKSFYPEVELEIKGDEINKYIFVSDENSGNVLLIILQDNELVNIIKNSIQADLNGYTISVNFDEENKSKITVKLDNYARSYLQEISDEKVLEFEDKNINNENYRPTYLANKFCGFKLEDADGDNILELIGLQNILYLNDNEKKLNKTAGIVETIFKINNNKIEYNKTDVKI